LYVACHCDPQWKYAKAEQEPHLGSADEPRSPNEVDDQNDRRNPCADQGEDGKRWLLCDHRCVTSRPWPERREYRCPERRSNRRHRTYFLREWRLLVVLRPCEAFMARMRHIDWIASRWRPRICFASKREGGPANGVHSPRRMAGGRAHGPKLLFLGRRRGAEGACTNQK
jgi:hypothetical protein